MAAIRSVRGILCGVGVALLVAGCGSETGGTASPVTTTAGLPIAAEAPSSFDPCTDIPQEVLASEDLRRGVTDANVDGSGGIKWRGCSYVAPDSYAVGITTTNLTVDMVRANTDYRVQGEYTVDGRTALAVNSVDHPEPRRRCLFYVAMEAGSLELSMSNPSSNDKTGHLDTCELALGLAEKVVPFVPDA
ncbi:DUF3558 domain-containing protein [Nocardia sp. NPDC050799]|uniref:DUF3558 domain-containing protein n=1 Tax=Nocardia sp. NPDC050799 TaxID=3154842 RepID=UPI0033D2142A